jgi:imidazolonepropionase-like amidohydrolase
MFAVRAEWLFDGVAEALVRRPMVFIDGGRIECICESREADLVDMPVVDLGDVTLMPGLIDGHQHLVFDASDDVVGQLAGRDDGQVLREARHAARRALLAGITTVRDLGDRDFVLLSLREQFARDVSTGPGLLLSGPPITRPGGHCWFLGGEALGIDGVREAVRARAARGVDVMKVMVTGGTLTPGSDNCDLQFSPAELQAIATEAHHWGLTVTGHAKCARGMAEAVKAGFDGIEHGLFETLAPESAVADAIAAAGLYVSDTASFVPPPEPNPRLREIEHGFAVMRSAGVRLILTSDAGINPSVPHDALPHGVLRLSRIGMSNVEALRAVTSSAAAACGVGDRVGRLAAGYDADIIAVVGEPLTDLTALLRVAAIFRKGIRVS